MKINNCSDRVTQLLETFKDTLTQQQVILLNDQHGFEQVIDGSDYVAQQLLRYPDEFHELLVSGFISARFSAGQLRNRLVKHLQNISDETELARQLRIFRRQQMVRIIWRDLARLSTLNETLEDLSELADVCVDLAVRHLFDWAVNKSGMPRDANGNAQQLVVIGMGKLGARELNLSSDIDLIFLYPERGQTDASRPVDNEQFFTRLARQLIKVIGENTADGFVFRVDARLRPFGDAGPLAIPFGFLEDYLQGQAREWERYAMVKARVISGEDHLADAFYQLTHSFVYRRYLDYGAIESIREMKKLIANEMHHRGMDANIKLGRGGIREIEFIGQAFQLIRGGRDPDLQIRPIQQVLRVLEQKVMLPASEVTELLAAYEFLRLTENRLQAWKDQQTHLLPVDDAESQQRLAASMGFENWQLFSVALETHRRKVQDYFDGVFAAPVSENPQQNHFAEIWPEIWPEGLAEEQAKEQAVKSLSLAGFKKPEQVWQMLQQFRNSGAVRFLGVNGSKRMSQLMPLLLEAVVAGSDADHLLSRLLAFLSSVARRTAYLALMVENPAVLSQLVRLFAESVWVTEQITRHPLLLDELIDPGRLYAPLKKQYLRVELQASLEAVAGDEEQYLERLRQFKQANSLRVAAADLTGVIPVEIVSDYLTDIAEVLCEKACEKAFSMLVDRHGEPTSIVGASMGFAVIGYGKVGGYELGYSSDLDLVFLHGSGLSSSMTNGDKTIANEVFYARMGQKIIHQFTTRMPSGQLYEIDMRLRPNGNAGMLVSSLNAFEKYQHDEAWTWEHQALVRARAIAGDTQLMAAFEQLRRDILSIRREPAKLQQDVREMREKMRDNLDRSTTEMFDIKQGLGGIADIEFMVQYAVLRWACDYSDLLDWPDNARILKILAKHCLLDGSLADELLLAYRAFRAEYHRCSLQQQKTVVPQNKFSQQRNLVKQAWQALMIDSI